MIKSLLVSLALMVSVVALLALPDSVAAVDVFGGCAGNSSPVCKGTGTEIYSIVTRIVNLLLILVGVFAVIMIIVGGIKYITSQGDASGTAGAKNTIIYSVIGLVIAVMAYAIVNFVLANL